jgi:hypothetical protein
MSLLLLLLLYVLQVPNQGRGYEERTQRAVCAV